MPTQSGDTTHYTRSKAAKMGLRAAIRRWSHTSANEGFQGLAGATLPQTSRRTCGPELATRTDRLRRGTMSDPRTASLSGDSTLGRPCCAFLGVRFGSQLERCRLSMIQCCKIRRRLGRLWCRHYFRRRAQNLCLSIMKCWKIRYGFGRVWCRYCFGRRGWN